jgi:hypothetical protein
MVSTPFGHFHVIQMKISPPLLVVGIPTNAQIIAPAVRKQCLVAGSARRYRRTRPDLVRTLSPRQRSVTECHDAARIPKYPSKPNWKSQETFTSQMTLRAHIGTNISISFLGSYCEGFKLDL